MTISKRGKEIIIGVIVGVLGNAIWSLIRAIPAPPVHTFAVTLIRIFFFVGFALVCIFIGKQFATRSDHGPVSTLLPPKIPPSTVFVLEVDGSQPLDSTVCDWRFFITNCTNRLLRHVELSSVQSDLGVYVLRFREIPVIQPGEKTQVPYEIRSRRMSDQDAGKRPTLWEFATDITGEGRSSYIWYKIHVQYREAESETIRDGDFVFVCFDLPERKMKTEGAEHFLKNKYPIWEP